MGFRDTARIRWMLEELTFVDRVLLITVVDLATVRSKFSCKNTPKFTARAPSLVTMVLAAVTSFE
jgi:hypothetical protein